WVKIGDGEVASIPPPGEGPAGDRAAAAIDAADDTGPEGVRLKGQEPHLALHRRAAGAVVERLGEGATARAGDVLQVSYVAAGRRRGAVLSIDGRGVVTLHFPERAGAATELVQEGAVPLAHAYELDDAPAFE